MDKTYSIQGQNFRLLPNDLNLLNKAAPLIARLRKLSYEYTKDLDLSEFDEYKSRINELNEAKQQVIDILESGINKDGNELSEEYKNELEQRSKKLTEEHSKALGNFADNFKMQNLLKLKQELEGYALIELLTDISFLKPILKKILTGGNIDSVNFNDPDAIGFIKDAVTDFFTVMNMSSLKS